MLFRSVGDPVVDVQVGGGLRTDEAVDELLRIGAHRVVVGTRALEDPDWIARLAARLPRRIVVAVDVRGRTPVVRGWGAAASRRLDDILRQLTGLPLAGVLVTAVHVEGRMTGPDLPLVERVLSRVSVPVIASGGIATLHDLRTLRERGVSAAVMGMALYDGAPDVSRIALEFAQ